ncbi:MAG: zf-TFIIB domain-containing protein [Verrucomicrobiota bacterium]
MRKLRRAENFNGMAAHALNCPNCGAATTSEATRCEHCNSRLATVACPSCFGMIFRGAKFCSHCGMEVQRIEKPADTSCICPRCRVNTKEVTLGASTMRECPVCEGLWVDTVALHQICTDRERQVSILGDASNILSDAQLAPERVRYIPCPVCKQLMHRINFAKCSNVIVDVCKPHGTWFDKDELHRIVKFIAAGGMDVARAKEMEQLEQKRRELEAAKQAAAMQDHGRYSSYDYSPRENAITLALGALVGSFFD